MTHETNDPPTRTTLVGQRCKTLRYHMIQQHHVPPGAFQYNQCDTVLAAHDAAHKRPATHTHHFDYIKSIRLSGTATGQ